MNQFRPAYYYVVLSEGEPYRAFTMQEIRTQMESGLIVDSQLMWDPSQKVWAPIHMIPWMKRTAVVQMPYTLQTVRNFVGQNHGKVDPEVSQSESRVAYPKTSSAQVPPKTEVLPVEELTKPVYIYPPQIPSWQKVKNFIFSRRAAKASFFSFCFALIGFSILGLNWWILQKPVEELAGSGAFHFKPQVHFAHYLDPRDLVVDLDEGANLTRSDLVDMLTSISVKLPEQPFTHHLFREVRIRMTHGEEFSMDGASWKELSILHGVGTRERSKLFFKSSVSLKN